MPRLIRTPSRLRGFAAIALVGVLGLAACGGDDETSSTTAPATTAPAATDVPAAGASISLADSGLGKIVVASDGLTLYLFEPDEAGAPTCTGDCAGNWPPYLVPDGAELTAGDGLDASLLSVVANPDGGNQLMYGNWPLYRFAGDAAPGDTNGQEQGDVWYVVGADAKAVE